MIYRYSLAVPANTLEAAPLVGVVPVTYGVLRDVSISFPPGAAALCNVAVLYHEHQIVPVNTGFYLAWDAETLRWPEEIAVFDRPFEFKLLGWNEDEAFLHTIVFRFDILPPRAPQAGGLVQRLFGSLPGFGAEG